jgi:hypothetical protein
MRAGEMTMRGTPLAVAAGLLATLCMAAAAVASPGDTARGGGVQLELPAGWAKVSAARAEQADDPRTLLVIGTDGVQAAETDCLVSSYRVPSDGAVVVVIGWRDSSGVSGIQPLSGLKLRRGTFECFAGRGGFAQVTRRNRDFQVNVMVGDRATPEAIEDALAAARSFNVVPRTP